MGSPWPGRATALVALACAALLAPTVSAAGSPPAGWVDRVHLEFNAQNATGQVLVDKVGGGFARVTSAIGKLLPGHRYRLLFSTDPCSVPLESADVGASVWLRANPAGASFQSKLVGTDGGVWRFARSARLMEEEGIFYFCTAPSRLHEVAPGQSDGATGRLASSGRRGVIEATAATGEITVSLKGLKPDARYRLILSPLTCAEYLEGDPDQPIVIGIFRADQDGLALRRTETVGNNETITIHGSTRIVRASSGATWGCANLSTSEAWP